MSDRLVLPANLLRQVDIVSLVQTEQHGAVEPVMLGQEPRQHRHRILATVFLIRSDQDDVLAQPWSLFAGVRQPQRAFGNRMLSSDQSLRTSRECDHQTQNERESNSSGSS